MNELKVVNIVSDEAQARTKRGKNPLIMKFESGLSCRAAGGIMSTGGEERG